MVRIYILSLSFPFRDTLNVCVCVCEIEIAWSVCVSACNRHHKSTFSSPSDFIFSPSSVLSAIRDLGPDFCAPLIFGYTCTNNSIESIYVIIGSEIMALIIH